MDELTFAKSKKLATSGEAASACVKTGRKQNTLEDWKEGLCSCSTENYI